MKSKKLFALILALVSAVCLAAFAACSDGPENENKASLSALTIVEEPTKKDYMEGDTFDPVGMVVVVKYTDNETKTITDYTCTPSGALTTDVKQITVSYTEGNVTRSAKVDITVRADSNLVDLEVLARPVKVDYMVGDMLDLKDLTLLAKYSDGSSREIKTGFVCAQLEKPLTVEDQKITVSYTEKDITKTAKFNISVKEPVVFTGIVVETQPTTTAYAEGDVFSPAGMVVKATYSDGSSKEISDYTYPAAGFTKDDTKITLSYTEDGVTKTVDVPITITKYLESITATSTHEFKVGETFAMKWIKVTGNYSDSSTADLEGATANKSGKLTLADNGTQIEISVGGKKTNFTLVVTDYTGTPYTMAIEGAAGTTVDGNSTEEAKQFITEHKYKEGLNNNVDGVAFMFNSTKEQVVRVDIIMAANESGDMLLKDIFDISLNGVRLSDEVEVNVPNPNKIAYYYFQKITMYVTVTEGDNTLRFVSHGGAGTNLAGVIITPGDSSGTVGAMTTPIYRIEAEHAILIGEPTDGIGFVSQYKENNSNHRTIGWTPVGMQVKFVINSDAATTAKFVVCVTSTYGSQGNSEAFFKDAWKTTVNGVEPESYKNVKIVPSDWAKLPEDAEHDANAHYNDYVVVEFEIQLDVGENVIILEKAGGSNDLDYVELVVDAKITWTDVLDNRSH